MEQSILLSTKKVLSLAPDDTSFDQDVLTFINSAFSTLSDVGIESITILDENAEWSAISTDPDQVNKIKTFVFLHVRLLFDPPATSYLLNALEKQRDEHLWRVQIRREATEWVDPDPPVVVEDA